jgi:hypothetical protein
MNTTPDIFERAAAVNSWAAERERIANQLREEIRPSVQAAKLLMPGITKLLPEVVKALTEYDRVVGLVGTPPNAERYAANLRVYLGDPLAAAKDEIRAWENITPAQLVDPYGRRAVLQDTVERLRINIPAELKRLEGKEADIQRNISGLQETIERFAESLNDRLPANVVVMVPSKRPAQKPTQVNTGHKIFS